MLRLKTPHIDDLFGTDARSAADTAEQDDADDASLDAEPQDRRDVVIHIPGRAGRVIPAAESPAARGETSSGSSGAMSTTIDVATPPAFEFLYDPPLGAARYRVGYGGRGKGTSWNFARALLILGRTRKLRILCAREFQSSMKDSVHKLLSDQIDALTLGTFYTVQETSIRGANGTEFIFKGLRKDIRSIKSTEGIDICWIEEAEAVSKPSWQALTPTIRKPGSEIWVSFNPALESDDTYQRFVVKPPPRAIVRKVSWRDNPWLPAELREEEQHMLATDPEAHANVWEGEPWARSDAQVLNGKWRVLDFTPDPTTWQGPYYGGDWGFAQDPTILVRVWIADKRLYVEYEAGGIGLGYDATERAFETVPDARAHTIRADSSAPMTIDEMKRRKWRIEAVEKWSGSVEDGITHLRSYTEIVIHSRCKRAIQEARLWRYKVDARTQEIRPDLQPGSDHVWDSVRYALSPLIKRRQGPRFISGSAA